MNGAEVSLVAAFAAGLVSFLSPCVLPVVPVFLAMLTGSESGPRNPGLLKNSFWFMAGFTFVFVAMGATASLLGQLLMEFQDVVRKTGAVFIVLMGANLCGFVRLPALQREWRPLTGKGAGGPAGALMLGMALAVGWTPCVGPILTSILFLAGMESSLSRGMLLLLAYAAGFAVPFLVVAVLSAGVFRRLRNWYHWLPRLQKAAGAVLILTGGALYFNLIPQWIGALADWYK